MANPIMSFDDVGVPSNAPATQQNAQNQARPKSKYWINVGLTRGTGENAKFLNLPVGIALDNLKAREIPNLKTRPDGSNNADFRNLRIGEADLWSKVSKKMSTLKPGERVKLQLEVELYMTEEKSEVTEEDLNNPANPYALGDLSI